MKVEAIRAVLLDLDDTLIDTRAGAAAALDAATALALLRCPSLSDPDVRSAYKRVVHEVDRLMERGDVRYETTPALHRDRWHRILGLCGAGSVHAGAVGEHYSATRREHHTPYPETREVLDHLRARYRLVMVTNGPADFQREKLDRSGLEPWFEHIVISGEMGHWKPDARIFEHALGRLGCLPDETVMVGDSLRHDIAGAQALGIRTVWMNRHGIAAPESPRPTATASDLRELVAILNGW